MVDLIYLYKHFTTSDGNVEIMISEETKTRIGIELRVSYIPGVDEPKTLIFRLIATV